MGVGKQAWISLGQEHGDVVILTIGCHHVSVAVAVEIAHSDAEGPLADR
jgi:hypothetical protein